MAIKAPGLWWRLTGDDADLSDVQNMMEQLDRWHGMVTGVFSGDECLAGRRPTQGTELCAVVEHAFSLETLLSLTGQAALGDRLERIIFNALPAACAPDMWSHQYDVQQVNQVLGAVRPDHPWTTNGPDANIFGLEPHYGCCTANFGQGWPKFAAHLWHHSADGGLACLALAPSQASVQVRGVPVVATLTTDYPFRSGLRAAHRLVPQQPAHSAGRAGHRFPGRQPHLPEPAQEGRLLDLPGGEMATAGPALKRAQRHRRTLHLGGRRRRHPQGAYL